MPYDRIYTLNEVHQILCDSERRPRPTVPGGNGHLGHAITLHADGRDDVLDRRAKSVILLHETLEQTRADSPSNTYGTPIPNYKDIGSDGRFVNRKDLLKAVLEALNSPGGQQKLRDLNTQDSVEIEVMLSMANGGCRAISVEHPMIKVGTGKNKKKVFGAGPSFYKEGVAKKILLIVDRLPPPNPGCEIHIQTAYPSEVI